MMEMVSSNVQLHNKIGEATIRRNEGVRCSKRVLDGMCMQMATTSTPINNNNKKSCVYEGQLVCFHEPCSSNIFEHENGQENPEYSRSSTFEDSTHHPVLSIIGPLYAPDDFEILEPLGEGFFSKVYKVKHTISGEVLVLKESKPTDTCRRITHADAAREAAIMRRLKHENVLELRGICISRNIQGKWDANLLVSYCEGGSLASLVLDRQTQLTWHRRVQYAVDIASAMEYIHGQEIIHRDLTSSNVLIRMSNSNRENGYGKAVVADFGLSCNFPARGEKLAQVGTTYFMSPECLKEEFYDEKSDVFSFGIILCQMIARIDVDPDGGLPRTSKFGFDYMLFTPLCPTDTPIELLKLAFNSCVMDPTARPSFEEARRKLVEILGFCPVTTGNKAVELMRDGKETRLGRSRSDAALKRPKSLAATTRKLSTNFNSPRERTVFEGEVIEESIVNKIEKLARDVAREEPEFRHVNPFLDHIRFRNERKILPPKKIVTEREKRRRCETKPDCESPHISQNMNMMNTPRRRCVSMPCSINDPDGNEHYSSFSYDGTFVGDDTMLDDSDYIDANASPASGIPMAYRDFDRKFLKQMIRFPSRRHTMHDSVAKTSASNYDVSMVGLGNGGASGGVDEKRRFNGNNGNKDAPSRHISQISEEEPRQSIVVYNAEKTPKLKKRIGQICSSAHQNVPECCIL